MTCAPAIVYVQGCRAFGCQHTVCADGPARRYCAEHADSAQMFDLLIAATVYVASWCIGHARGIRGRA